MQPSWPIGSTLLHAEVSNDRECQRHDAYFWKRFCLAALSFWVTGVRRLSVGDTNFGFLQKVVSITPIKGRFETHLAFAVLLASNAFAASPLLVALPNGAWMCAACAGLCIGWIGRGESLGVVGADMAMFMSLLNARHSWMETSSRSPTVQNEMNARTSRGITESRSRDRDPGAADLLFGIDGDANGAVRHDPECVHGPDVRCPVLHIVTQNGVPFEGISLQGTHGIRRPACEHPLSKKG